MSINIVKHAIEDRCYSHFFRLNRATRFLEDPTTTLPEMKAWFGWKAAKTVDPYIGYSRRHICRQRGETEKRIRIVPLMLLYPLSKEAFFSPSYKS